MECRGDSGRGVNRGLRNTRLGGRPNTGQRVAPDRRCPMVDPGAPRSSDRGRRRSRCDPRIRAEYADGIESGAGNAAPTTINRGSRTTSSRPDSYS